jgi:hypothetical protein
MTSMTARNIRRPRVGVLALCVACLVLAEADNNAVTSAKQSWGG